VTRRAILALALLLGAFMLTNGAMMLIAPFTWYLNVPGVLATGPYNAHFVRDIGLIYAFGGLAFFAGVRLSASRLALWVLPTLWLAGHAVFHFVEVATGICPPSAIPRDFVGVTLPALIGIALCVWAWRSTPRPAQ
jgi:hypothetical protein